MDKRREKLLWYSMKMNEKEVEDESKYQCVCFTCCKEGLNATILLNEEHDLEAI